MRSKKMDMYGNHVITRPRSDRIKDKTHSHNTLPANTFQKIIVACTLVCFAVIWVAAIHQALTKCFTNLTGVDQSTGEIGTSSLGWGWRIAFLLVLAAILLCFFRAVFRHFEGCSTRQLCVYVAVMFLGSVGLYLFLLTQFRIIPITDSHSVLDQALSLARNGLDSMSADSIYASYFSKYANNYPVTLLFAGYFWLVEKLGVSDIYLASYVLNMGCLMLGSLFAWLTAKRAFGARTAAKVLLLCVMNPVYYLMVFWVYTNTISIPFVMALIYLALCVRDARSGLARMLLSAAFGAVTAVGIQLRATTAIPVIAVAICFAMEAIRYFGRMHGIRDRRIKREAYEHNNWHFNDAEALQMLQTAERGIDWKKKKVKRAELRNCLGWTAALFVALIVIAGVYLSISTVCNHCFQEVSDGNYPVTHWLMMGSHGNGTYNIEDDTYTFSFETAEEKKDATLAAATQNYKELGVTGTIQLYLRKMVITWSDGYFALDKRLGQTMQYTPLYSLLVGEQSDLFRLYCQVFWLAVGFFVICACVRCLTGKRMRMLPFLLILTLFGAIVFYWFWEVKAAYALPFLPVFYLLAGYGSGVWQKAEEIRVTLPEEIALPTDEKDYFAHTSLKKKKSGDVWEKLAVFALILLFAITAYQKISSYEITHYDYSIYSDGGSWMKSLDLNEGDTVTQEFYPNADFNRIALRIKVNSEDGAVNDCKLHITLTDVTGTIVYHGVITAADVDDQMAVFSVGEHPADTQGGYVLTITKEKGSSGNLLLRTRKGLCLDDYRGTFTICGEAQVTDLYLQVYREYN